MEYPSPTLTVDLKPKCPDRDDFPRRALSGEDLWGPDFSAQAGPGSASQTPSLPSEILYSALAEAQGERGSRGTEPKSGVKDRPGGPSCDLRGRRGEHLVPLRSLFDICVAPKARVVFETL